METADLMSATIKIQTTIYTNSKKLIDFTY